ncbi:unnamed protein product [Rotaria sp. Silwood2]|nr:unnamed protein product [Rotaria sp. Silwood2]CAF4179798.1 unnamed protein product [Rotaria sp. Silwood2]
MSNELILCVWDHLSSADVIYSFSNLNTRIDSLLLEFHGLYKELDLRYCSLSACRFLCRQVPTMIEWRLGLTVLKLGNRYRSCQIDLFGYEVAKSIVIDHLLREGKSCQDISNDMFRVLMTCRKHVQPIFPQLTSFIVFQTTSISEECRDALLYSVAGGSAVRTFTWNACSDQTHHSRVFFDWLFQYSVDLVSYQLRTPPCENGFELTYEHTTIHNYVPHRSLVHLTINILNLTTLYVLLHYLPQLEYLGQLIKLSSRQILSDFIETFRTSFWLDGPLGSIRVCIDYHEVFGFIQMFSLPYTFSDTTLFLTIDLIGVLFNTREEKIETSDGLSVALGPLWYEMRWLLISLVKNQKIPMSFLRALQYCKRQGKVLVLSQERGIMSNNIEDYVQLTHFTKLQLNGWIDASRTYDLERLIDWLRLLPNITCLYIDSTELKYWFTNNCTHPYLDTFLQRLDRLYVDCSSIMNINLNEEFLMPFLSFVIDKRRFPRLVCLRLIECKHISSAWSNINKWIDFILIHINEHQLKCLRFDFIEKEHQLPDIQPHDEIITIIEPSYVVNIHRLVLENYVSFWIERKQK